MSRKFTKSERKAARGPNAMVTRSLKCTSVVEMSDGSVYRGQDARYMDMGRGLGYAKMAAGVPYVKIKSGN